MLSVPRFSWRILLLTSAISIFCFPSLGFSQADQDQLFEHAVEAYNQNKFAEAAKSFEAVNGPHADEAKQYLSRIKAYREAVTLGDSVLNRSADELDIKNLDYAIKQFEQAISIKSDGPWDPKAKLEKAKALEAPLQGQGGGSNEIWSKEFCQKAQDAARAHRYKEAVLYSCPLANDSPGYLCNGDEALHLCQQMRELAESHPDAGGVVGTKKDEATEVNPQSADNARTANFSAAVAAFDKNNFDAATKLFETVNGNEQEQAREYLQRIENFNSLMKRAAQAVRNSRYDEARSAYQEAARLKADGPGDPKAQAMFMDLEQGISEFYSANYDDADRHLEAYAQEATERQDLAHFYLGASKVSRFLLGGSQDQSLREEALREFHIAKQQGFKASNQDVSPKILKAYEQMNF